MTGGEVHPIETESYSIMAERVDLSGWSDRDRPVVARVIHATADETFASSMRIGGRAVEQAVAALQREAPVICDAQMVRAGMAAVARLTAVECYLPEIAQAAPGSTRSAAAITRAAERHREGALWVIGNAPTALAALLAEEGLNPAAVIGVPVGYVGAAEAKQALWASEWQELAITNVGPRGGSSAAAAVMNALARLAA